MELFQMIIDPPEGPIDGRKSKESKEGGQKSVR
jgi:hypothetical protein